MAIWEQLEVSKAHVAYACVGVFSSIFSLVSLFVKEKLYIGESTVAGIFGLIVGPHCLNWFNPLSWGHSDSITLEITRIVLCLQIFAVAVELPRKYMWKHWYSVALLLLPVMTSGWLIIGLFVWIVMPALNFADSLLVSSCITATDPILAQSVVSGKFAQRVPGHLRNLLSAESGCNDGMAFPFIYLSLNLIIHAGNGREIVKDWICVTILYECIFGCFLGVVIGYLGKVCIKYAEKSGIIDRESFLAFYVVLAFMCAGFGSLLGVDDLLVSFAAGTAFSWDGWFSEKTHDSNISTVIDVLLNYAYFIYFGAIIPWEQFNNPAIGTNIWRLIILSFVVIFLRRIPAILILKPFIPDIKSWREAMFVGHFGPIGVGAIFAAILARSELELSVNNEETPLSDLPEEGSPHWKLIACLWPMTSFFIVTSIIVHGSSVAIITLGRHLNTITLTKTFTTHTTNGNGKSSWMQRLPSLDKTGRSFSLQRVDTEAPSVSGVHEKVETSGTPAKPAGGMRRRKHKKRHRKRRELFGVLSKSGTKDHEDYDEELNDLGRERLQREKEARAATFALSTAKGGEGESEEDEEAALDKSEQQTSSENTQETLNVMDGRTTAHIIHGLDSFATNTGNPDLQDIEDEVDEKEYKEHGHEQDLEKTASEGNEHKDWENESKSSTESERAERLRKREQQAHIAYQENNKIIIENKDGEIIDQAQFDKPPKDEEASISSSLSRTLSEKSAHSLRNLQKIVTPPNFIKMHGLVDADRNNKYYAYKIDNLLIIEDEEGEVLRRYKINTHADKTKNFARERSGSVVSKALSAVGLKAKPQPSNPSSAETQTDDLKKMVRNLTPAPKNRHSLSEDDEEEDEEEDEDEEEEDGDEQYEDDTDQYEDDSEYSGDRDSYDEESGDLANSVLGYSGEEEPETAIERERRLNALGQFSAPRDDDDEEEFPKTSEAHHNAGSNAARKMKTTIGKTFHLK
ncbi:hypothetical protein HG535_0G03670 [Zygotorulaspora mrakii]|uniref:Na(+)/H(+) antiporter n=1 Tax=Zygotorulaspora mrakii TaxID=42260 RepID=A0A7H9B8B2_ZYGMR|nr:uncharacterized protein HG535_0G03670 [Zygotorulaspora mrakii]QLG74484.1 hypothetical protein HG535_0G03670 [Zygotorulaspora mrakii]